MSETPKIIDGARVLRVADLSLVEPTGATRHVVGDIEVNDFVALAVARYDSEPGVYLLYCDADWNAVTDTYHESVEAAIAQARLEFGPVEFTDVSTASGSED
jgi:hypothetical protein